MSDSEGSNLPDFRAVQLDFAAHIRNPELHQRPSDVSAARMQVYLDLFYKNIEGFLAGAFPVAKRVLDDGRWHELARRFVHEHPSESPYFLDISQEFLSYLDQAKPSQAPDFLLELCHYEWVELSLKVDDREVPALGFNPEGDLLREPILVNPLHWLLSYRYPVHRIQPGNTPAAPPAEPSWLVVYRGADDAVRFLESNALTHALLQRLSEPEGAAATGTQALQALQTPEPPGSTAAGSAAPGPTPSGPAQDESNFLAFGAQVLTRLRELGIVLGTLEGKSGPS